MMGKVEIGIYCCLTADIWQKFYRNVPWVVLYETYEFCPNRWIWLVAMVTGRLNLQKNIQKSSPQKPLGGWSWNSVEMFITLASTRNMFFVAVFMCFRHYGNLKAYNGKSESRPLFLSHCRYSDKSFTDTFLDLSSTKYMNFVQMAEFDWLGSPLPTIWILSKPLNFIGYHGNRKAKLAKKY